MAETQRRRVEELLREAQGTRPQNIEGLRSAFDQLGTISPPKSDVNMEQVKIAGVNVILVKPEGAGSERLILFCHAGGYVMGTITSHLGFVSRLSDAADATVAFIEYRLAPENPYPAAIDDVFAVYQGLLREGGAPREIAFAGDSAGGALVLAALLRARDHGLPMPSAAALFSPFGDLTGSGESFVKKMPFDLQASPELLDVVRANYVGHIDGVDLRSADISPVFANLEGLPPLLFHVGTYEALLDDTLRIARNAALADVPVTVKAWPRMQHIWQLFAEILDEGQASIDEAGAFLSKHLECRR